MKKLTKKETAKIKNKKKAQVMKDLSEGVDKFTSYFQKEALNTFRELDQFRHGIQ